jgi:hypothetical protein
MATVFSSGQSERILPENVVVVMRRSLFIFLAVCVILLLTFEPAFAQCAMCKQTLENSETAVKAARGMNAAILILFLPPVMMFVGIFGLIYRSRNKHDRE